MQNLTIDAPAPAPVRFAPPLMPAGTTGWSLSADLLLQLPLLMHLSRDQAEWLARRVVLRRFSRGTRVIEQGQRNSVLYFLLKGSAHAVREADEQKSMIIDVFAPGDHFGEMGVIDDEPSSMSVRCITGSEMLVVRGDDFAQCLTESSALRDALLQTLVRRMRKRNQHIALLALSDVRGRVLRHMLDVCEERNGERIVQRRINRQRLANMVGASREMVSRVLRNLAQSGAIEVRIDGSTLIRCAAAE